MLDTLNHALYEAFWDLGFVVVESSGTYSTQAKAFTRSPDTSAVPTWRDAIGQPEIAQDPHPQGTACNRLVLKGPTEDETYPYLTTPLGDVVERFVGLSFIAADATRQWASRFLARFHRKQVYIRASFARFVEIGETFKASFEQGILRLAPHHAAGGAGDIYQVRRVDYDLVRGISTVLAWQVWDDPANQAAIEPETTTRGVRAPLQTQVCYFAATTAIRSLLPDLPAQDWVQNTNPDYRPPGCSDAPLEPTDEMPHIWRLTREYSIDPLTATAWDYDDTPFASLPVNRPRFAQRSYHYIRGPHLIDIQLPDAEYLGREPLVYALGDIDNREEWLNYNAATRRLSGSGEGRIADEPYGFTYTVSTAHGRTNEPEYADTVQVWLQVAEITTCPKPTNVRAPADTIGDTNVVVWWDMDDEHPNYNDVSGYRIGWTIKGEEDWDYQTVPGRSRRFEALGNLCSGETYTFTVQALCGETATGGEEGEFTLTGQKCANVVTAPTGISVAVVQTGITITQYALLTLNFTNGIPSARISKYEFQLRKRGATAWSEPHETLSSGRDIVQHIPRNDLVRGGTWQLRMRSISGDSEWLSSDWTAPIEFTVAPSSQKT